MGDEMAEVERRWRPPRREFLEKAWKVALGLGAVALLGKERPSKRPVRVVFFGDSITSFSGDLDGNPKTKDLKFQDWVEQGLEEEFSKIDIVQASVGLPGGRFFHKRPELDPRNHLTEVLALKPEIVVIQFGNNDLKFSSWPDGFEKGMRKMVSEMVKEKIKVILVSLVKGYSRPDRNYDSIRAREGLDILEKIAAEFSQNQVLVADVYTPMDPEEHILDKGDNYQHPNEKGHELIGKIIAETVAQSSWLK